MHVMARSGNSVLGEAAPTESPESLLEQLLLDAPLRSRERVCSADSGALVSAPGGPKPAVLRHTTEPKHTEKLQSLTNNNRKFVRPKSYVSKFALAAASPIVLSSPSRRSSDTDTAEDYEQHTLAVSVNSDSCSVASADTAELEDYQRPEYDSHKFEKHKVYRQYWPKFDADGEELSFKTCPSYFEKLEVVPARPLPIELANQESICGRDAGKRKPCVSSTCTPEKSPVDETSVCTPVRMTLRKSLAMPVPLRTRPGSTVPSGSLPHPPSRALSPPKNELANSQSDEPSIENGREVRPAHKT